MKLKQNKRVEKISETIAICKKQVKCINLQQNTMKKEGNINFNIKNGRRDVTTDHRDIKRIIREY